MRRSTGAKLSGEFPSAADEYRGPVVTLARRAVSSCPARQTDMEDIMALRVPRAELPIELGERMIEQFGAVPEPLEATWHSPKVAEATLELGGKTGEWDAADENLKS